MGAMKFYKAISKEKKNPFGFNLLSRLNGREGDDKMIIIILQP